MKAKDFARMIAITPEHLSRTERNGQFKWSTDKLARLVIAAKIGLPIKQVQKILMRKFKDGQE